MPPIDLPIVWDGNGIPSALPFDPGLAGSVVFGFRPDGTPLGNYASLGEYPQKPVFWSSDAVNRIPFPLEGGTAVTGTGDFIFGHTTAVSQGIGITRIAATLWYDDGQIKIIDGLDGVDSVASGVNSSGIYVGVTLNTLLNPAPGDYFGAYIGRDGSAVRLNFPGFPQTRAYEINDAGRFTGVWQPTNAPTRGYVATYDLETGENSIADVGLFPGYGGSWPLAINNDNTIVGGAHNGGDFLKALIWRNGSLVPEDLNLMVNIPGVNLLDAYRVNNAGQILAEGLGPDGYSYYILNPIPEPAAAGAAAICLLARRRR